MRLSELAGTLGAKLVLPGGDSGADGPAAARDPDIDGVATIQDAQAGQITFLTSGNYERFLATTQASAVILGRASEACTVPQLVHPNPYWAFARATQLFFQPVAVEPGVDDRAFVAADAVLGRDVCIYAFAYVDRRAQLGDRVVLYPGVYVGPDTVIGDESVLHPSCVIESGTVLGRRSIVHAGAVIGGDGFGFAPGPDGLAKIAQSGRVLIGDEVEIGPNSTIDRGALADTTIGHGTKIDSQVQIAHNVRIGRHCMLCGMTAIAGSAKLGDGVLIAGHSAVNNHCEIGDGVRAGGMTGLTKHTKEAGEYLGMPAMPAGEWRKEQVRLRRLPKLEKRVKELEEKLSALLARVEGEPESPTSA